MVSDIKNIWLAKCHQFMSWAKTAKDPMWGTFKMLKLYDDLSPDEKKSVYPILADWLLSEDCDKRYDASFLTNERQLVEMIPALKKAIVKAENQSDPGAPFEVKKYRRILEKLE